MKHERTTQASCNTGRKYVFSRRFTILLQQQNEALEHEITVLHEASSR